MIELIAGIGRHLLASLPWMSGNLLLALFPWALATWLFRTGQAIRRSAWVLRAVCVAFLPNAAYVLTDVIHLPRHVRSEPSDAVVVLGVLPLFAAFMAIGFVAYMDVVHRIAAWARSIGWTRRTWPVEFSLHAVSSVGIYLGRVHRFNSWDLVSRPDDVGTTAIAAFTRPLPVAEMLLTFVLLVVGHVAIRGAVRGLVSELVALRLRAAGHR